MKNLVFSYVTSKTHIKLCSNCTADLRLCFRFKDTIISLLRQSKISASTLRLHLYRPLWVGPDKKTCSLKTRLIISCPLRQWFLAATEAIKLWKQEATASEGYLPFYEQLILSIEVLLRFPVVIAIKHRGLISPCVENYLPCFV